jgi:hypothetical protein
LLWPLADLDGEDWSFLVEADGHQSQVWTWIKKADGPKDLFFLLPEAWGDLTIRFLYDGPRPKKASIPVKIDAATFGPEVPDESLLVADDGGLANVAVFVTSKDVPVHPDERKRAERAAELTLVDGLFQPRILPLQVRQKVRMNNASPLPVNFLTSGGLNDPFNYLVRPKNSYEHSFGRAERSPVPVQCALHTWMRAYLLPLDHPYAGVTGKDGVVRIGNLPAGEWTFRFWHEKAGYLKTPDGAAREFKIRIEPKSNRLEYRVSPEFAVKPAEGKKPESEKEGGETRATPGADVGISANGEIRGQLIDDATGKPVVGAVVSCGALINDSRQGGGAASITDQEGRYRLVVPSPGIYTVLLKKYAADQTMTAAADDGLKVEAGKVTPSRLRLVRGRTVTGKVVDENGEPMGGLDVMCYSAARPQSLGTVESTMTSERGEFQFHLAPGRARIYSYEQVPRTRNSPLGLARSGHVDVDVSATGDVAAVTLRLAKSELKFGSDEWLERSTPGTRILNHASAADVTGTVVDSKGSAVADAQVFKGDGPIVTTNERGEFRYPVEKGTQFVMYVFQPSYRVWFGAPTAGDDLKIVLERKQR